MTQPRSHPGRRARQLRSVLLGATVLALAIGALIVFRPGSEEEPEAPGGDAPKGLVLPSPPEVDLSSPVVPLTSFEEARREVSSWGGGVFANEHVTDGQQSYQLNFPVGGGGGLQCRPGSIPADFSQHERLLIDATSVSGPLPLALTLLAADGSRLAVYPEVWAQTYATTLEFDLAGAIVGGPLRGVASLRLGCALRLDVPAEIYIDHVRLAEAVPVAGHVVRAGISPASGGFLRNGDFARGLAHWAFRSSIAGGCSLARVAGEAASPGSRALGFFFHQEGDAFLRSSWMDLPPGRLVFRGRARADGQVAWSGRLLGWKDGRWHEERLENFGATPIGEAWEEISMPLRVRADREDPSPSLRLFELTLEGVGQVSLGSLQIRSLEGAEPPGDKLSGPWRAAPGGGDEAAIERWRPEGRSLRRVSSGTDDDGERDAFPLFWLDPLARATLQERHLAAACREAGLRAAADLRALVALGDLGEAIGWSERYRLDEGIAAWILSSRADATFGSLPPDLLRQLHQNLATEDTRLLLVGLQGRGSPGGGLRLSREHVSVGDAVLVHRDEPLTRERVSLQAYHESIAPPPLDEGTTPYLARIVWSPSDRVLKLQGALGLVAGAAGWIVVAPGGGAPVPREQEDVAATRQRVDRLSAWTDELAAAALGGEWVPGSLEGAESTVAAAFRRDGGSQLVVVNLSSGPVRADRFVPRSGIDGANVAEVSVEVEAWDVAIVDCDL